jgi:hypothetical protein
MFSQPDTLTNCTLALNSASGGSGGSGGSPGSGQGSPGVTGINGVAYGALVGEATILNCILATNLPANCYSGVDDAGHNLSSSPGCLTNVSSLNGVDPKLASLAWNGGPTPTMALLPGSPAIDAAETSTAPFTDQRGFPRPYGSAADIGAFEYGSALPGLTIARTSTIGLDLLGTGNPGQACRLMTSTDLLLWSPLATNRFDSDGKVLLHDQCDPAAGARFYRLATP